MELEPAVGFTDDVPWEPLPADSFTANVAAQDDDPASLLNHYRRLIQLRTSNEALQTGEFVPLDVRGHPDVLAYLRHVGSNTVLVLANLSEEPRRGVTLTSGSGALPEGSYAGRVLFGGGTAHSVAVRGDGRINDWTPIADLGPLEVRVIALTRQE